LKAKALAASFFAAASLAAPPAAQAHLRSGVVAVDYRAKASPLRPLRRALTLSI
jgi:hypothetical protein